MSSVTSKDEWVDELRNKSKLYTRPDANQNYLKSNKVELSDSETDNDSGIRSIDGDFPQENLDARMLNDSEIYLSRQDSGVDVKSTECKSITLPQKNYGALVTTNTRFPCNDNEQVTFNDHMVRNENKIEGKSRKSSRNEDFREYDYGEVLPNQDKIRTSDEKRNSFGKNYDFHENTSEILIRISDYGRNECHTKHITKNDALLLDQERLPEEIFKRKKSSRLYNDNQKQLENKQLHCCLNPEVSDRPILIEDDGNYFDRAEVWRKYKKMRLKLTEIIDQLLYEDLMYAQLTAEIAESFLNHSNNDDEILGMKEEMLQEELSNTERLLQTTELISERQQVESHLTLQQMQRTDNEIRKKRSYLQLMQRKFRNSKFKAMPKQLKRYCSVESLLSDAENEHQQSANVLMHVEECWDEEVSLV